MGAEALEKVSLYWLCHLPEAGALQIRRIGELAGSFREAYYIEGTQLWKKGIFKKEENAYRFDNWKKEFSRLEEEYYRLSEKGIRFITPLDADYPKRLYSVYDYPMGLYIKGELHHVQTYPMDRHPLLQRGAGAAHYSTHVSGKDPQSDRTGAGQR